MFQHASNILKCIWLHLKSMHVQYVHLILKNYPTTTSSSTNHLLSTVTKEKASSQAKETILAPLAPHHDILQRCQNAMLIQKWVHPLHPPPNLNLCLFDIAALFTTNAHWNKLLWCQETTYQQRQGLAFFIIQSSKGCDINPINPKVPRCVLFFMSQWFLFESNFKCAKGHF